MKKILPLIFLTSILSGCFDKTFDFRDPQSLENMMSGMSLEEQKIFLDDIQLAADTLGGEYKLNDYTSEEIKAVAENTRSFLNQKNIDFLREKIRNYSVS